VLIAPTKITLLEQSLIADRSGDHLGFYWEAWGAPQFSKPAFSPKLGLRLFLEAQRRNSGLLRLTPGQSIIFDFV
jgi:hypothetical protein